MSVPSPTKRLGSISDVQSIIHKESWQDHFIVEDTIGRGKFAVVKTCIEKETQRRFAAKCIRKRRHCRDCTQDILHEIAVLELSESHPHLIDLHRVYESASEFVLILEYAAGGEIFDYCIGVKDKFSEATTRRLFHQILQAVSFLHSNNIAHLDLKPQNILLTEEGIEGDIKIVDFGLSKHIAKNIEIREILGTPDYVAPEVLNFEPINTSTDIWSLGVVCYVMLTGVSPFLGETKNETLMNVTTGSIDFPDELFNGKHSACKDMIWKMLQREPTERITAEEILKHPWVSGHVSPKTSIRSPVTPCHLENGDSVFFENNFLTYEKDGSAIESAKSIHLAENEVKPETVVNGLRLDGKNSQTKENQETIDINGNICTSPMPMTKASTAPPVSLLSHHSTSESSQVSAVVARTSEDKENSSLNSSLNSEKSRYEIREEVGLFCSMHTVDCRQCGCKLDDMHIEITSLRKRRKFDPTSHHTSTHIEYNLACVDILEPKKKLP